MRNSTLIIFLTSFFLFSCDGITNDNYNKNENTSKSKSLTGTFVRVGSSGTGQDIVARNGKVHIVGGNSKIYYYNTSSNSWVQEPGGGTAERIARVGNKLLIRGGNDKVYRKSIGSSTSWEQLSSFNVFNLDGARQSNNSNNADEIYAIDQSYQVNKWNGSSWNAISNQAAPIPCDDPAYETAKPLTIGLSNDSVTGSLVPVISHDISNRNDNYFYDGLCSGGWTQSTVASKYVYDFDISPITGKIWYVDSSTFQVKEFPNGGTYGTGNNAKRITVDDDGTVYIIGWNNAIYELQ